MKKSRFNEHQIFNILNEGKAGIPVDDLCRKHGIGQSTYYKWRSKYAGMEVSDIQKLKTLEDENRRLKELYAKVSLEKQILQDVIEGKL